MHNPSTLARARAFTARALALGLIALAPLGAAQAADAWPSQSPPLLQPSRVILRAQLLIPYECHPRLLIPYERHPRVPFGDGKAICSSFICCVRSGGREEPGEDHTPDTRGYTHAHSGRV